MHGIKRLAFIDALKGVLILFVLFHHVLYFSLCVEHPYIYELFSLSAMPTFFFVSGYLNNNNTKQINSFIDFLNPLIKIIQRLLLPTFCCAFIYITIHNGILSNTHWTIYDVLTDANWQGYWFTPTLFVISFMIIGLRFFSQRVFICINFLILILSPFVTHFVWQELGPFSNCFCIPKMLEYFPCYSLGVLIGFFSKAMSAYFNKKYFLYVLGSVCIIYLVCVNSFRIGNYFLFCFIRLFFSLLIFALFLRTSKYWERDSQFVKFIRFVGQSSLCVYLLHYFFLPRDILSRIPSLHSCIENNLFFKIAIGGTMTLVIITIVLVVAKILRRSRITSIVFLGEKIVHGFTNSSEN